MSDDRKVAIGAGTLLGMGFLGILGIGIWKLADWFSMKEKKKQELIDLIIEEEEALIVFQDALSQKGFRDEFDEMQLDTMEGEITVKIIALENYNTSWVRDAADAIMDVLRAVGIYAIIPYVALSIAGALLAALWRKRPPRGGPPPTCPKDGLIFSTQEELEQHVFQEHPVTSSPQDIQSAQAIYQSQYLWVQEMVAADSETYHRAKGDWNLLTPQEQLRLAMSMAVMATAALVPGLGPAAALLLLL